MNYKKIIPVVALATLLFTACDDIKMEWEEMDPSQRITAADIPLKMAEKIARYDVLKSYTNMKVGVGVDLTMYMENEQYRNIVNANFDEVVIGYHMKHGPMVNSKGEINFANVDAFVNKAKEAGLGIYGHTLVWHQNQNASYLNGIIAPQVIPGSAGSNVLDLAGLKDGSFTNWNRANPGSGISVVDNAGLATGGKAVKLVSSATAANAWNLQMITPDITVVSGHNYEVSFYIRSEQPGKGRISFSGLSNNYPWKDWLGTGASEAFETSSVWKQVKFPVDGFTGNTFKMAFDLGYLPNVTYYIDIDNIMVVDKDAAPAVKNLITNGNFEGGNLDGWGGWGNGSTRSVTAQGEGYGNKGYAMALTNPTAASNYSAQQVYTLSAPLEQGVEYTCTFMVKATTAAKLQVQIQGENYNGDYYGGINVGTTWAQVEKKITPSKGDRTKFIFDFGETACTFFIDDIVLTTGKPAAGSGPIIVEKTEAEKKQIIGQAMENFIVQMVSHYKNDVKAWDVVNEPMNENGTVRDGNVADPASDVFYWQKYLGQDFAVTAFKLARQHGNANDILFINDYNLEYSLAKCDGLIQYVQYIESKGAKVDGIGTQMHISINSNKDNIVTMFQKLAATGKMIKVTELEIKVETNAK